MPAAVGILVEIDISGAVGSGTDDPIYVGIMGPGGGREFPLDRPGKHDGETGSINRYIIGTVPSDAVPANASPTVASEPTKRNSPDRYAIDAKLIQTVYLRKREGVSKITDDAVSILRADVRIFDEDGREYNWHLESDLGIWLGTRYGFQVALTVGKTSTGS